MLQRRSSSIRVAGLRDQRVEAIVVFGREDRVRILDTCAGCCFHWTGSQFGMQYAKFLISLG